jgi:hypothetical protein
MLLKPPVEDRPDVPKVVVPVAMVELLHGPNPPSGVVEPIGLLLPVRLLPIRPLPIGLLLAGLVIIGAGTVTNGLMPPPFISVAPSGIVPPLSVDEPPTDGFISGDAMPADEVPAVAGGHELITPPSNVDMVPRLEDVPLTVEVVIPETDPPVADASPDPALAAVVGQLERPGLTGIGLMPPGLTSVAPSGIPDSEVEEVEPGMPSGEVDPMAGPPMTVCATAASQLSRIAILTTMNRRIGVSC